MALHFDYTECDLKDVPNDVIETMIHVTMVIDVGEFTKKNVKDIFYRIKIAEMFNGTPFIYSFENETKSILADQDLKKKIYWFKN